MLFIEHIPECVTKMQKMLCYVILGMSLFPKETSNASSLFLRLDSKNQTFLMKTLTHTMLIPSNACRWRVVHIFLLAAPGVLHSWGYFAAWCPINKTKEVGTQSHLLLMHVHRQKYSRAIGHLPTSTFTTLTKPGTSKEFQKSMAKDDNNNSRYFSDVYSR